MIVVTIMTEVAEEVSPELAKAHADYVMGYLKPYLRKRTVEKGIVGLGPNKGVKFSRIVRYYFDTMEDYEKSWVPHYEKFVKDNQDKNMSPPSFVQVDEIIFEASF